MPDWGHHVQYIRISRWQIAIMRFRFTIVGAGLTGTSMLYQLIRRLERQARSGVVDPRWVKIRVLEKGPEAGPGFPHNEHFVRPYHITRV